MYYYALTLKISLKYELMSEQKYHECHNIEQKYFANNGTTSK